MWSLSLCCEQGSASLLLQALDLFPSHCWSGLEGRFPASMVTLNVGTLDADNECLIKACKVWVFFLFFFLTWACFIANAIIDCSQVKRSQNSNKPIKALSGKLQGIRATKKIQRIIPHVSQDKQTASPKVAKEFRARQSRAEQRQLRIVVKQELCLLLSNTLPPASSLLYLPPAVTTSWQGPSSLLVCCFPEWGNMLAGGQRDN